jgi:ferritin-like metal-binding protein YciE
MPAVTSPEQLFEHELQDMYYAEKALTRVLPKLADEATDGELSRAFQSHLKETEKHVTNLEKVFREIGKKPEAHPCPGIEGIKKEHDDFVSNESPTPDVLDAFLTGAGARTEHYEIAAYEGLVTMATAMGEDDVASLLNKNLEQEKAALSKMQTIGKRLAKNRVRSAA